MSDLTNDHFAYARPDAKWPPDRPDLHNGDWECIADAAHILRISEGHVRDLAPSIGKKVGGRWWISILRGMNRDTSAIPSNQKSPKKP